MTKKTKHSLVIGITILFVAFVLFSKAQAAIQVDATSTSAIKTVATFGWTHVVTTTGANTILLVEIGEGGTGAPAATAVTYNGVALSKLMRATSTSFFGDIWYLLSPATGSHNVSATLASAPAAALGGAISFTGVNQSTPFDATSSKGATTGVPSSTITLATAGDEIFDIMSQACGGSTNPAASNTSITAFANHEASFGSCYGASYRLATTTGINVDRWTSGAGGQNWEIGVGALKAASGATNPDATSISATVGTDGARSGASVTITGTNFGTVSAGSRATCNGAAGTGCIQFIVGGTATVDDPSVTAWTNTSITFTVSSTLATTGGTSTLQVWAANASDTTPLTYYIYPKISAIASLAPNAARTNSASDSDGLIMLQGDHFGTAATSSIFNILAIQHGSTGGPCSSAGFTSTTLCLEVPTSTPSSTYSGTIILDRTGDNKQATTSLALYPRITGISPTTGAESTTVQLLGDHFCGPSGTCPVSPNRSSTTNRVLFGPSLAGNAGFLALTGGAGACNGSGVAWVNTEICVQVPPFAVIGSTTSTVLSNSNSSNEFAFTVTTPTTPGTPGVPTYGTTASSTIVVSSTVGSNSIYTSFEMATSSGVYALAATSTTGLITKTGLLANTTYYFRAYGTNGGGNGVTSATSSRLTIPDIPLAPSGSNIGTSTVLVTVNPQPTGAATYVYQNATSALVWANSASTSSLSLLEKNLNFGALYFFRMIASNAQGNAVAIGPTTTVQLLSSSPPNPPSLDLPASSSQGIATMPTFKMTATDPDGNGVQYKVTIYSNAGCTTVVQTDDQSVSQTGWSGQNASSSQEYSSGTQGNYVVQSALSGGTTYYWKASAKDPDGSNSFTDSAGCAPFSTTSGLWTVDSGTWVVSSSALTVTPASGADVQIHAASVSQTNGVIEFKAKSSAVGANTGNVSGIVRADSGANGYRLTMGDFLNNRQAIGKMVANAFSFLTTGSPTFSASTFYDLRGSINGSTLNSWVNGTNAITTSDAALSSSGFVGLNASSTNGSATFTFEDFAFYSGTTITMNGLLAGDSWSVRDHSGTTISCQTGTTWDLSTYTGMVPIDYDNGGGSLAVWTNGTCNGAADQTYPPSGLATDIFGGDSYTYTQGTGGTSGTSGGTVVTSTSITVSSVGAISY